MKQILGKLTPEKVDETMENLREQNALGDEIVESMNNLNTANQIDDVDLDAKLEELQQEQLDEQMLKMGTVPVSDAIHGTNATAHREPPSKVSTIEAEEMEAELKQLQAKMAM
ncbi:ESCRT-III component [Xylariaceae sp. FL0662B]|nr:ESCRT-III component [Xylariaceae sp. FL0662B]